MLRRKRYQNLSLPDNIERQWHGFSRKLSEVMGGPRFRVCLPFVALALISAFTFYSVASRELLHSPGSVLPQRVLDNSENQKRFDSASIELLSVQAVSLNASTNSISCGFTGNSDIYGLGIRLGVYLQ